MGKPDALDRLVQFLIALPALLSIVNGGFMVWDPHGLVPVTADSPGHRRI